MGICSVYKLTVGSFVLGAVTVVLYALSISTDWWLTTRESHMPDYMLGEELPANMTLAPMWMRVWAGLWRFCVMSEEFPEQVNCMAVVWKAESNGRGEAETLTSITIISAARRSVALPVSASVLSVIAVVFIVAGNIRKDCRTLVGGVCFILSGLSLAVGMILYISSVNDEVGYRVSTEGKKNGFSYAYGWSFFTAGLGFLSSELAAVVSISLFLRRNSGLVGMARIIPGLEDKLSEALMSNKMEEGGEGAEGMEEPAGAAAEGLCCHLHLHPNRPSV